MVDSIEVSVSDGLNMLLRISDVFERNGITFDKYCLPNYATSVFRFELVPGSGVKISQIRSCEDDLNAAFSDFGPVRIIEPVPGKGTIAVEIPRPGR